MKRRRTRYFAICSTCGNAWESDTWLSFQWYRYLLRKHNKLRHPEKSS